MVLETDDAVVGIENKFNAVFQNGQPKKYVDFLRDRATKLGEIRGHELIHLLVVLAPESRQKEIEEHIKNTASDEDRIFLEDCCFLSWQAVLRDMEGEMPKMDPGDAFLFTELKDYIELSYGFPRYLQDSMPQLWARWESYGTKIQRDMKDRLWYLIPEEYRRNYSAGFSKNYTGFYLMIPGRVGVDDYPAWVWFGFEDAKKVRDDIGDQKACFLISTKIEFDNPPDKITKATMRLTGVDGWTNHGYECWMVNFDDGWNRPDIWEAEFREFFKLIGPVEV